MHEEVFQEVSKKLLEKFSLNVYGELKTYVRVKIFTEIKQENPYLDEMTGFYSMFDKAWERIRASFTIIQPHHRFTSRASASDVPGPSEAPRVSKEKTMKEKTMKEKKEYQGHESYNAWNVALWIGNDEGLYDLAKRYKRRHGSARLAAVAMLEHLNEVGVLSTPDGVRYTKHTIELAMRGL